VQTFLPYPDFARSAAVLDTRRLGKQRVEALQILRGLRNPRYGWRHHPAVRMWRGYDDALLAYAIAVTTRWRSLGCADTVLATLLAEAPRRPLTQTELARRGRLPWWLGMRRFHRSHRSALVRKDPAHYRRFFPRVPDDLPYVWPGAEPPADARRPHAASRRA
jgi:Pyrimidine dimer DNA glycosylase